MPQKEAMNRFVSGSPTLNVRYIFYRLFLGFLSVLQLYTWGSGYHGQLALGTRQVQPTPAIVSKLLTTQQLLRKVWFGSHHCAAVTTDGELYTWGSNRTGCLGRKLPGTAMPNIHATPRLSPYSRVAVVSALPGSYSREICDAGQCWRNASSTVALPTLFRLHKHHPNV